MATTDPENPDSELEPLVEELVQRWLRQFKDQSWAERLELLNEMHEQLLEDLGDMDLYCAVSPLFIARLIEALAEDPIGSMAQAHIYANSANEEHRRAAGDWLARHQPERG